MSDNLAVIPNTRAGEKPPAPALKSDNSLFKFRMHFNGFSKIAFADNYIDLCEALMPGYTALAEDERLSARLAILLDVQVHLRSNILVTVVQKKHDLKEWEYAVLASEDRAPHGWSGDNEESVDFWSASVPLVLLDADYAPYADVLPPVSSIADVENPPNIIWLRCSSEEAFINSLERAGVIAVSSARNAA